MASKMYSALTATLFAMGAVVHMLRLMLDMTVQIGVVEVPRAVSWIGVPVALALSVWGYVSAAGGRRAAPGT